LSPPQASANGDDVVIVLESQSVQIGHGKQNTWRIDIIASRDWHMTTAAYRKLGAKLRERLYCESDTARVLRSKDALGVLVVGSGIAELFGLLTKLLKLELGKLTSASFVLVTLSSRVEGEVRVPCLEPHACVSRRLSKDEACERRKQSCNQHLVSLVES
jgi:hypothetical protein